MRRREQEITAPEELDDVFASAEICRIALPDGDIPYIVPVNFGYRERRLYFHTAPQGRKMDLIRRHPRVGFEVEADLVLKPAPQPCGWSMAYRSVIGWGVARILEEEAEKRAALDIIMAHYTTGPFAYRAESVSRVAVVEIRIEEMTGKRSN